MTGKINRNNWHQFQAAIHLLFFIFIFVVNRFEAAMYNHLKSAPLIRLEQSDKIEFLETQNKHIVSHLKELKQPHTTPYQGKKFTILGTKIAETDPLDLSLVNSFNNGSTDRLDARLIVRHTPFKATDILGQILQRNLSNYNHLINYNYRIRNHEDELKNNRLNFLYGMRHHEQTFSVRPASLNDLSERLSRIYTIKSSGMEHTTDRKESGTQTRIVYNLSKKQSACKSRSEQSQLTAVSMESIDMPALELPVPMANNKYGLVEFNDFNQH